MTDKPEETVANTTEATPAPEPAPAENAAPVESAAPAAETAPEPAKAKKSKKGLIIGLTCGILGAGAIAGTAFALMNTVFKGGDPVSAAIEKLFTSEKTRNVGVKGNISADLSSDAFEGIPFKSVNIDIDSKASNNLKAIDGSVKISAKINADYDTSLGLDFKVLPNGEKYIKVSGINNSFFVTTSDDDDDNGDSLTNCIGDTTGTTNCDLDTDYSLDLDCSGSLDCVEPETGLLGSDTLGLALSVMSLIDDQWIKLPAGTELPIDSMSFVDDKNQCLVSAMGNMTDYGKNLSELYKKNSFIKSSTENISVAKKKDAIYRLSFDSEKLANFTNEVSNSKFANDIMACSGSVVATDAITAEQVEELTKQLPAIYVEIDGNNDFTRLYIDLDNTSFGTNVKLDLSFEYPASLDVAAPSSYKDITEVITSLFSTQSLTF